MTSAFFLPSPSKSSTTGLQNATAYRALIKCHAHELHGSERFKRLGRMTPNEVHAVARDLAALDRGHQLDETIESILARVDALHLQESAA